MVLTFEPSRKTRKRFRVNWGIAPSRRAIRAIQRGSPQSNEDSLVRRILFLLSYRTNATRITRPVP